MDVMMDWDAQPAVLFGLTDQYGQEWGFLFSGVEQIEIDRFADDGGSVTSLHAPEFYRPYNRGHP